MNTNPDKIPIALKQFRNWVAWDYEKRGGKATKVPKNPKTGYNAASNNPDTWGSFGEAIRACEQWGLTGVGFILDPDTMELVGVDLDDCIDEDGELSELASGIVAELDSYTEITPSGRGLRIFVYGQLPAGGRKKSSLGFEIYDRGRFLTVTGNHLSGTPTEINEQAEAIQVIHRRIFGTPELEKPRPEPGIPVNLDDSELIEKARSAKNGGKFSLLWDGDFTGYSSQSEADLALCNLLAFWVAGDADRIDHLFRLSGLYRPKWDDRHSGDGRTYGQMTIEAALARTRDYYEPKPCPAVESRTSDEGCKVEEDSELEVADPELLFQDVVATHSDSNLNKRNAALKTLAQALVTKGDILLTDHYTNQMAREKVINKGPFRELLRSVEQEIQQQQVQTLHEAASKMEYPASWPYTEEYNRLHFHKKKTVGGAEIIEKIHVADFIARKVQEITTETGSKVFKVEGQTAYGQKFSFEIASDDFADEKKLKAAIVEAGGAKARIMAGMARHLQPAIDSFTIAHNGDLQQFKKYERTGWAGSHFLLPGLQPDNVIIKLPPELPYSSGTRSEFQLGVAALEALFLTASQENSTIVLAFIFQAPLAHLCGWSQSDRYALFLAGQTGTFKTSFSQTAMALYGPGFVDDTALVRWGDGGTRNAIMRLGTFAHDLPFLVDNFKPNTGGGEKAFYSLLHAILEGGEKARLNRGSELRARRDIRTWPIITGEDCPDKDPASLARLLKLEWADCNPDQLTKAQRNAHHLCAVGVAWLRWLGTSEGQKVAKEVATELGERRQYWSEKIKSHNKDAQNAMRMATNLAMNELTFKAMCHRDSLLRDVVYRHGLPEAHQQGLERIAREMADHTATSLEARRFLEVINELLASERFVLEHSSSNSQRYPEPDRLLGWEDDQGVYLLPNTVRHVVDRHLGWDGLGQVTNTKLYEQLEALDALANKDSQGRRLVQKRIRGKNQRVLHLKRSFFFGDQRESND